MSWWVAGTTFAAGTYSAYNKRKGANSMADERRRAARESLLTAKYNIRERNKESRQTQFQVLETGGNLTQQIAIEGKRAEGAATVAGGSSGAVIDSGSPRAVLTNIAQEALAAQTDAILDTKNRIKAISRDTENQNKSEWRNAKLNKEQQYRIASKEKQAAQNEFASDMIKTGFESYAGGSTMAGTGNISKWGKAAKTAKATASGTTIGAAGGGIPAGTGSKVSTAAGMGATATATKSITSKKITPKKMKGYSMNKVRPTSGKESSRTWERLVHQAKTRSFDFSTQGFSNMFDFARGGKNSAWWNFISGRGIRGKAASTTFPRK